MEGSVQTYRIDILGKDLDPREDLSEDLKTELRELADQVNGVIQVERLDWKMEQRTYYILEWNALDDDIGLYEFKTDKTDEAEIYEELSEGLHNYSNILILDRERLENLFKAVDSLKKKLYKEAQTRVF